MTEVWYKQWRPHATNTLLGNCNCRVRHPQAASGYCRGDAGVLLDSLSRDGRKSGFSLPMTIPLINPQVFCRNTRGIQSNYLTNMEWGMRFPSSRSEMVRCSYGLLKSETDFSNFKFPKWKSSSQNKGCPLLQEHRSLNLHLADV